MDKSVLFIKMCDCDEVFNLCRFRKGDWFVILDEREPWMIGEDSKDSLEKVRAFFKGITFIPCSSQIRKMMGEKDLDKLLLVLKKFRHETDFAYGYFAKKLTSMEQLGLAFYMYEKHNKIWDGDKWMNRLDIAANQAGKTLRKFTDVYDAYEDLRLSRIKPERMDHMDKGALIGKPREVKIKKKGD